MHMHTHALGGGECDARGGQFSVMHAALFLRMLLLTHTSFGALPVFRYNNRFCLLYQ